MAAVQHTSPDALLAPVTTIKAANTNNGPSRLMAKSWSRTLKNSGIAGNFGNQLGLGQLVVTEGVARSHQCWLLARDRCCLSSAHDQAGLERRVPL